MAYALEATIQVPSAVSALSFGPQEVLCVGSDDGSVRWYGLPSTKVSKAIKSLGDEVSSILWTQPRKDHPASIWIASGSKVFAFPAESQKIIMNATDASCCLVVGEDDEDVLNELSISDNGKLLAFGTDSGSVGTIEISTQKVSRMRASHTTICGSVKFIPDRPSELLSGGYDSALLHFDISQGNILSRLDITAPPPTQGVSLSPPFVLSISLSPLGLLAASTADGRVWLGGGGEKRPNPSQGNKKKRSRKWEGLKEDEGLWVQVADGPVVSTVFRDAETLLTCSLLGAIAEFKISRDSSGMLQADKTWSSSTSSIEKVNAIAASQFRLVIGGFGKDGKGVVEVWRNGESARSGS
ncbi:WD40 repeat-like protein [Trametes sanguinea]|nr:WD40 repeat-like protein [Trametes sanguinea]